MNSRNQALDVLRCIAVVLVMGHHYERLPWFHIGWSGVDLFFVLSGFLISGLLFSEYQRTGTISLKRFWIRRGLKIYPPFYALMLFTVVAFYFAGGVPRAILGDIFFVQNYFPHIWIHGWSLAVEEHFYFLLPLLLLAMMRIAKGSDPFRWIPLVSIVITVWCLAMRWLVAPHDLQETTQTHMRMDALFMGVTLGYYHHFRRSSYRVTWRLPVIGSLLLLPSFVMPYCVFTATAGLTLVFTGFGCIVMWAANQSPSKVLAPLAWVGYYSYSIYLWHVAVQGFFMRFSVLPKTAPMGLAYMCSSILVGVLMAKLIELPILKLRDRYFPSFAHIVEHQRLARAFISTPASDAALPLSPG